ncbi:hypothetical protein MTO96_031261 [Rhipicephalus appendiculatus]|uniref:Phospholipase A2 n=1 Tax=Rhipicephalus appendiculatus TaxID=34631 RepID=A0A131YQL8_RHIAP
MIFPSFRGWYRLIPVAVTIIAWLVSGQTIFDYARHLTHQAERYLDDIKFGIKAIRNGLNTVEDVLKDSKEPGCAYKCPDGSLPKPKIGYKADSNGCGAYGFQMEAKELPHKEMNSCCHKHDLCYGTCLADKDECDARFLSCLDIVCDKKAGRSHKDRNSQGCKAAARAFYTGSQYLGCKAYKDAQKQACYCAKKHEL